MSRRRLCRSIPPIGPSERVLLTQSVSISSNGTTANLVVPQAAAVSLDVAVQPGKEVRLMVITEKQWQAASAGERIEGPPLLRTTVSGLGTKVVQLQRGTYVVALFATDDQGMTQVTLRARGRAM